MGIDLTHLIDKLVVRRLPHLNEVVIESYVLFVILEPHLADCAIAVARTRFWLHDFSNWNLEYFRTDSELVHSLLLFSILLVKFIWKTEPRCLVFTIPPENWYSQLVIPITSTTRLWTKLHHGEVSNDLFARDFLLHRKYTILLGWDFLYFLRLYTLFDFMFLCQSTFSHCN